MDTVIAESCGIALWKVKIGDMVEKGQLVAEIMNVENIDAPRIPAYSKCDGLVLTVINNQLIRPGQHLMKIIGKEPLEWRVGNLLTLWCYICCNYK